jgi:hypothetical protein
MVPLLGQHRHRGKQHVITIRPAARVDDDIADDPFRIVEIYILDAAQFAVGCGNGESTKPTCTVQHDASSLQMPSSAGRKRMLFN